MEALFGFDTFAEVRKSDMFPSRLSSNPIVSAPTEKMISLSGFSGVSIVPSLNLARPHPHSTIPIGKVTAAQWE